MITVALSTLGCSKVLGADFDQSQPMDQVQVSISLPEHPHETPHTGQPLPPSSLTGSGVVTTPDGQGCASSCSLSLATGALQLEALPSVGSVFGGWRTHPATPCDGSRSTSCLLESTSDVTVEAYFVRNGANVWGTFAGVDKGESADLLALARVEDRTFVVGDHSGILANLTLPTAGVHDAFVAEIDHEGGWKLAASLSTSQGVLGTSMASASFGPVIGGRVDGVDETLDELAPLGVSIERSGAFVVAYTATEFALEPRWSWILGGKGSADVRDLEIGGDGTTFVLGTYDSSLVTSKSTLTGGASTNAFLAGLDENGEEKWIRALGTGTGSGMALAAQAKNQVVVALRSTDIGALGGNCETPTNDRMILARFDPDGACEITAEFPENVSGIDALAVDSEDRVYVAGRFVEDFGMGLAGFGTSEPDAVYVLALTSGLLWNDDSSWGRVIEGSGKLGAIAVSDTGVLFTVNGDGAIVVDGSAIDPSFGRGLLVGKLSPIGQLEWIRTFQHTPSARILGAEWDGEAWLIAGSIEADPFRPFDLQNVTQPAMFQNGAVEAFVGRFSD